MEAMGMYVVGSVWESVGTGIEGLIAIVLESGRVSNQTPTCIPMKKAKRQDIRGYGKARANGKSFRSNKHKAENLKYCRIDRPQQLRNP
jgi:hypothetical protein